MSVIADFSIPANQFALGDLLEVRPGIQIRLEAMIPTGDAVIPYFWVRSPDVEAVEATLQESPMVSEVHVVDEANGETLFRVEWVDGINGVIESISDHGAVVLDGEGHGDHWSFQLRFPEYDTLSAFYRDIVDKGISIDLEGVHNPVASARAQGFDLSPAQREALAIALEEGYFAVPRETTLVDLAEKLGISDSAVSQRIRRGLAKILSSTLTREQSP